MVSPGSATVAVLLAVGTMLAVIVAVTDPTNKGAGSSTDNGSGAASGCGPGNAGALGGSTNSSFANDSGFVDLLAPAERFLKVGLMLDRGEAKAARGVSKIVKESKQAPNTLLLLGVLVIERYMGTPYNVCWFIAGARARDM